MPRVATADEVLLAANYKAQQKRAAEAQASLLGVPALPGRSEEHSSELQSLNHLVFGGLVG